MIVRVKSKKLMGVALHKNAHCIEYDLIYNHDSKGL